MKYFGTDGFRGRANEGLDVEHAYKIGRFVGWYYGARQAKKARVILGKDTRRSSYMFESALVSGLVASGADAYMLHVIPTPGVSFEVVDGAFDCGVIDHRLPQPLHRQRHQAGQPRGLQDGRGRP